MKKKVCLITAFLFIFPFVFLCAADTMITIDAGTTLYMIPDIYFGSNLAAWVAKEDGTDPLMIEFMRASNRKLHRWPGGSWGDYVIWDDVEEGGTEAWWVSYEECLDFLRKIEGTMQPIVNCGAVWGGVQHTQEEAVAKAAEWVRDMNITRNLGVKIWEIGNEMHGSWEEGYCQNGTEYAQRYCNFYRAMKAVDPTILCGADAIETEDGWNSWMALMLTEFQNQGIIPDFLIIHYYPTINQPLTPETSAQALSHLIQPGSALYPGNAGICVIVAKRVFPRQKFMEYVGHRITGSQGKVALVLCNGIQVCPKFEHSGALTTVNNFFAFVFN